MGGNAAGGEIKSPQYFKHYQCVTFNAKVGNYETDIVIDSGSGITIMNLELFNLIHKCARTPLEMNYNNVSARSVTGDILDIIGTTCVELDLGESIWFVECYVVCNFQFSFLLGTNFLIKASASINLGSLQARIGAQTVSVSVVKRPRQVQVCVVDSLEIPARSEALLKCAIRSLSGTVFVEPKYEITSKNSSLYPARCVANIVDGEIPIKIANPNSFPVSVFAGTCVGMAESLTRLINNRTMVS